MKVPAVSMQTRLVGCSKHAQPAVLASTRLSGSLRLPWWSKYVQGGWKLAEVNLSGGEIGADASVLQETDGVGSFILIWWLRFLITKNVESDMLWMHRSLVFPAQIWKFQPRCWRPHFNWCRRRDLKSNLWGEGLRWMR